LKNEKGEISMEADVLMVLSTAADENNDKAYAYPDLNWVLRVS
jgi:hypothetical protein